jgi:hypothetical protein
MLNVPIDVEVAAPAGAMEAAPAPAGARKAAADATSSPKNKIFFMMRSFDRCSRHVIVCLGENEKPLPEKLAVPAGYGITHH